MKPMLLHYYITNRCNSRCQFCSIWSETPKFDASFEDVLSNLKKARGQGCRFVDFTGGEPLLHPLLPDFLYSAKKIGFITSLTTNCILFNDRVKELAGKIDLLHFSIDADNAQLHNKIRGSDSFNAVCNSISPALKNHLVPDLIFTYTDDNINSFSGVYNLARQHRLMVILDPVFSTEQKKDPISSYTHHLARTYAKKSGVYLNTAHLIFRQKGGNNTLHPRCKAVLSTIVISPDNKQLLPCYHHAVPSFSTLNGVSDRSELFIKNTSQKEGRYSFCEGCHINCYFDPSYNYRLDRLFFCSLKSKFIYIIMKYFRYQHLGALWRLFFKL